MGVVPRVATCREGRGEDRGEDWQSGKTFRLASFVRQVDVHSEAALTDIDGSEPDQTRFVLTY